MAGKPIKLSQIKDKDALNFFFEMAQMKRIKHEGWRLAGVEQPDSVADHSLRAAQIAFILAEMEGYEDPFTVCTMLVFHDIGEARTGDIHKVALRYVESREEDAVKDQLSQLFEPGNRILSLWQDMENKSNTAGIIAKDADLLEQAITAKEYLERGYYSVENWILNIEKKIETASAKRLLVLIKDKNTKSVDWWKGLKKL